LHLAPIRTAAWQMGWRRGGTDDAHAPGATMTVPDHNLGRGTPLFRKTGREEREILGRVKCTRMGGSGGADGDACAACTRVTRACTCVRVGKVSGKLLLPCNVAHRWCTCNAPAERVGTDLIDDPKIEQCRRTVLVQELAPEKSVCKGAMSAKPPPPHTHTKTKTRAK